MYDKLCVKARSMPFWCVSNPLADPFGGPVQPKIDSLEVAQLIADAKKAGLIEMTSWHDDDLVPWDPENPEDDLDPKSETYAKLVAIRKILRKAGVKANASICSLHGHPMFKEGGLCNPDPKIRALAAKKVERTLRIGTFLGAKHYVYWVARDGFESYPGCDFKRCYDWLAEGLNHVTDYIAEKNGVKILGTSPSVIDLAEDRDLFREMMDKLEIPMPESGMATTVEEALEIAHKIGYPAMVRPSYVLGGRGMEVVYDDDAMVSYMNAAVGVTPDRPILIDRFLNHALECEADAISDGTHAFVPAVMEHIELAGVHSGDSACIIPSVHISEENVKTIKEYTKKIAEEMHVKGLMNMQYAIENGKVYVLEANPRASRTVPLVSKVCNIRMVPIATDIITSELTGRPSPVANLKEQDIPYYGVKEAVFPFNMFPEVDPILGPEMRSTGEVLGLALSYGEAFYKAQEATQSKLPLSGTALISVNRKDKEDIVEVAQMLSASGFRLLATGNTHKVITEAGIEAELVKKLSEGRPNILDMITNGDIDLIINSPAGKDSMSDDSYLRKAAIKGKIPYMTTAAAGRATAKGIQSVLKHGNREIKSLQQLHSEIKDK